MPYFDNMMLSLSSGSSPDTSCTIRINGII